MLFTNVNGRLLPGGKSGVDHIRFDLTNGFCLLVKVMVWYVRGKSKEYIYQCKKICSIHSVDTKSHK